MRKSLAIKISVFLVVSMLVCMLTACSSTEKASAGQESSQSNITTDSSMTGELNVMIWLPEAPDLVDEEMAAFEKDYPGMKINLQMMTGNGIVENLQPRIAAGNLPDMFSADPMAFTFDLADQGMIADISDTEAWNAMFPALQKQWTSPKGVKFGVGAGIATQFLYYNKEVFTKAGITEMPTNWDEFLDVCKSIKKIGVTPLTWFGGSQNLLTIGPMSLGIGNQVLRKDPDLINKLAKTAYDYGTPEWIKVFEQMKSLDDLGLLNDGFMSTDMATGMKLFSDGKTAMMMQGSWVAASVFEGAPFECGIILPPWNDKGEKLVPQVATETGFSIANNENVEKSKVLFNYIAYKKYSMYQNKFMSIPPFEKPVGEMKSDERVDKIAAQLGTYEITVPFSANIIPDSVHEVISKFVQDIYVHAAKPEEVGSVLNEVQEKFVKKEDK